MNYCQCKSVELLEDTHLMIQALIEMNRTFGQKEEETWLPFQTMVKKYGLSELMRRIQKGTITVRKEPEDEEEWQFRDIVVTKYMDNNEKTVRSAEKTGKLDLENWMQLKTISKANKAFEPEEGDPGLLKFLKLQGSKKDLALKDSVDDKGAPAAEEEDPQVVEAEKLSQLGEKGVKAKSKVKEMLELGTKVMNELVDKDLKNMLKKKLYKIEKMSTDKVTIEDLKAALLDVYITIKKVKKAESIS